MFVEAMFRLKLTRVKVARHNCTYFQYKITELDGRTGARLRFNANEWVTCFLIPSEREIDFSSAIGIIDDAMKVIKKTAHCGSHCGLN